MGLRKFERFWQIEASPLLCSKLASTPTPCASACRTYSWTLASVLLLGLLTALFSFDFWVA